MEAILTELERSIRDALDDTARWEQASLFEIEAERDQFRKDRDALARRLASIPGMPGAGDRRTSPPLRRPEGPPVPGSRDVPGAAAIAKGGTA